LPLSDFTWNASANDSMTATLYVEAVSPSKAEGDVVLQASLLPIDSFVVAGSDAVRFTALRTKQSWTNQALSDAGITQAQWAAQANPSPNGLKRPQAQVVQKVYSFYQGLYNQDPTQFLWAGLAKVAGGAVFNGLTQAQEGVQAYLDAFAAWQADPVLNPYPDPLLQAADGHGIVDIPEFLKMQKDIFNDLAWQFEAYHNVGLFAITLMPKIDLSSNIDTNAITAWTNIDSGSAALITQGNDALLNREQLQILQPDYNQFFPSPEGNILGLFTQALFPQSQTFTQVEGITGNIANFTDRWNWISQAVIPIWDNASQAQRTAWVGAPLGSLAHN
jgi:hypothetical protein